MRSEGRDDNNRFPIFTSDPPLAVRSGELYQYQAGAIDPENDPLTFLLSENPTGMTVNATNGLVEFLPGPGQVGTHPVILEVQDPRAMVCRLPRPMVPMRPSKARILLLVQPGRLIRTSDPLSYFWSFGDGMISTEADPIHTYAAAGEYIVTLFINDGNGGTDFDQSRVTITRPNRPPTALVDINPTNDLRLGESVRFDASPSFDLDGDPLSHAWNLGDGTVTNTGTVPLLVHAYAATGLYAGSLVVDDSQGGSDTNLFVIQVDPPNNPPVVSFAVTQVGDQYRRSIHL